MDKARPIRAKLERAKKHIRDLEVAFGDFFKSGTYAIGTKIDPESGRDGIAHFFLDKNPKATGHLQISSTMVNTYAKVSALLLKYLQLEIVHLREYYNKFMAPHIHIGMILPVVEARDWYMVVCPDDESKAESDDFN